MTLQAQIDGGVGRTTGPVAALFDDIARQTMVEGAIRRTPYGEGEQIAADIVADAARSIGLAVSVDLAGNLHMSWEASGSGERCFLGSHLDSVPRGGNFDGLAGVLGGLAAVAALREAGLRPRRTITVLGMRGEENAWFACQHIGSRIALGLFEPALLDTARRADTGRTLGEHMLDAGIDLAPIRGRQTAIAASQARSFLELHIEQGPVLENRGVPIGVVTGIRGNLRYRSIRCVGEYGHAGTVPRAYRRDAVLGFADFARQMEQKWAEWELAGMDLVLTFGVIGTNPAAHSATVVPGEVSFSVEARSHSADTLTEVDAALHATAETVGASRQLQFSFEGASKTSPVLMDAPLRARISEAASALGINAIELASGAGHDAADFAEAGIRSAMIFVRNANGSHNPTEAMAISDFLEGVRVLAQTLASEACG